MTTETTINLYDNSFSADVLHVTENVTNRHIADFLVAYDTAVFVDDEGPVYEWAFAYDGSPQDRESVARWCGYSRRDVRFTWN